MSTILKPLVTGVFSIIVILGMSVAQVDAGTVSPAIHRDIQQKLIDLDKLRRKPQRTSPTFKKKIGDVKVQLLKTVLNGPKSGSHNLMWECLLYDYIANKTVMGSSTFMKSLYKEIEKYRPIFEKGKTPIIPLWGSMTQYGSNGLLIKYVSDEGGSLIHFSKSKTGYKAFRFTRLDRFGTLHVFDSSDGLNFKMIFIRRTVLFNYKGQTFNKNILVYCKDGNVTVPLSQNRYLLAVTLDKDHKPISVHPISIAPDIPRTLKNTSKISSFQFKGKEPKPFNKEDKVTYFKNVGDTDTGRIRDLLTSERVPIQYANWISSVLVKKGVPAYVVGSTVFSGSRKNLLNGTYQVAGMNYWHNDTALAYQIAYKKNNIDYINLSDGSTFDTFKKNQYSLTWRSNDNQRIYVCYYSKNGSQLVSALFLYHMGAKIQFDPNGLPQSKSMRELIYGRTSIGDKKKCRSGYINGLSKWLQTNQRGIATMRDSQLAIWMNPVGEKSYEYYSVNMIRLDKKPARFGGTVIDTQFMRQIVPYSLARYGSSQPEILQPELSLYAYSVSFEPLTSGRMRASFTKSNTRGEIIDTWEKVFPEQKTTAKNTK